MEEEGEEEDPPELDELVSDEDDISDGVSAFSGQTSLTGLSAARTAAAFRLPAVPQKMSLGSLGAMPEAKPKTKRRKTTIRT